MLPLKILAAWLAVDVIILSPLWIRAFRKPPEHDPHRVPRGDHPAMPVLRAPGSDVAILHASNFAHREERNLG